MISDLSRVRQIAGHQLILLVGLSFLLLTMPSIIRTPFAVPGQQKEFLINQGSTLALITPGNGRWKTIAGAPVRSPIHQVVQSQEDAEMQLVAAESGLYAWTASDDAWSQLYPEEVFSVAESGSSLLIGTRAGLLRRPHQGQSWQATGLGLPERAVPVVIRAAPGDRDVVYLGTAQHGLFRSQDGGQHFEPINQGLPRAIGAAPVTLVMHLVIDPTDADTAYASTEVNGVYKTSDGGRSWKAATEGLPGLFPYRTYQPLLALHPTQAKTLYAVIGYPVHSHLIENKIYKTTDGGEHWVALSELPNNTLFRSLTIISVNPVELALGFEGGVIRVQDKGQQVDGGPYWKPSPPPLRASSVLSMDVGDIAVIEDDGTLNQNFDLHNRTIEFAPTPPGYTVSTASPSLETDFGAAIPLGDNASLEVTIPFPFRFYGTAFSSVFINANGNLTFGRGDSEPRALPALSFAQFRLGPPKIAALWENYNPPAQGSVNVKAATNPSRLVVTWNNVRLAGSVGPDSSTFQIVLLADNRIRMNFGQVITNPGGLVGLSPGNSRASALTLNLSRDLPQTIDNRAVFEFFTGRGLDIQATARAFYRAHQDLYDQLVVFGSGLFQTNLTTQAAQEPVLAFHTLVQNGVQGIGLPVSSIGGGPAAFGSHGRLQSVLNLNRLSVYPPDPNARIATTFTPLDVIGHETAHRWLAYLLYSDHGTPSSGLLQSDLRHWNFFLNTDASLMYGNRWRDNEDGTFASVEATTRYSALDEYAMGLRPPVDINSVFFIQPSDAAGRTRNSLPEVGVTVSGSRTEVSLDQIIAQNGPRLPGFGSSPTALRQAYILVVPEGQSASPAELEKLDRFRQAFERFFNQITSRRAVVDTRLSPGQPDLLVEAATVKPSMLNPGDTAMVSFTIRNKGTAAAGLALNEIRFSVNDKIKPGDPLLKQITTVSLSPGDSVTLADVPVIIPPTVSAGPQFITLAIDVGNAVNESDESNNQMAIPIMLLGSGIKLTPFTESEPNDRMSQANPITPNAIITATLNPARDVDFYSFNARSGQTLTIDINARSLTPPSPADTVVTLFDSAGTQLAENDDFAGSPDSFLQFVIPRAGQYFFRVRNAIPSQGGPDFIYQAIVILRSPTSVNEVEPNDSLQTANEITPDVVINGVLNPAGDQDFFVLTARAGQILTVSVDAQKLVEPSAADTLLSLLNSAGGLMAENDDYGGSKDSFLQVTLPQAGRYFIRLRDVAGRGGPNFTYRVTVRLVSVHQRRKP